MKKFSIKCFTFYLVTALFLFFQVAIVYAEQAALKEGMSGDSVLQLQKKLQDMGYYQGGIDGSFGAGTASALAGFQGDNGLESDGVAGQETLRALQLSGTPAISRGNGSQGASTDGGQGALKQGMSGDRVLQLQKTLQNLGYYNGNADGSFGTGTASALAGFQKDNSIESDGVAGQETLRALQLSGTQAVSKGTGSQDATPDSGQGALKQGMFGDRVLQLQKTLQNLGYYNGSADGSFGTGTASALAGFQKDNSLEADGVAGQETLRALQLSNTPAISRGTGSQGVATDSGQGALKQGMSGDRVLQLQKKLQSYGYYQGALDGNYGAGTSAAVADFQWDCDLDVDGMAGSETLRSLQSFNPSAVRASRGQTGGRNTQTIVSFAKRFLGVPYVWAGRSPSGFDCSGFVSYVFGQNGIALPRMADEQYNVGVRVSQPQAGDLVFFSTYEVGPSHVGICIGNDQFIHASSGTGDVTITPLSTSYYSSRYLGARRVIR